MYKTLILTAIIALFISACDQDEWAHSPRHQFWLDHCEHMGACFPVITQEECMQWVEHIDCEPTYMPEFADQCDDAYSQVTCDNVVTWEPAPNTPCHFMMCL